MDRPTDAPPPLAETAPDRDVPTSRGEVREAGWRHVLAVAAVVVVGVLALQVISMFVPVIGDLLGAYPTVIVILIAVTAAVVFLAFRRQRR